MRTFESPPPQRSDALSCSVAIRAMLMWPRLDRRALARCGCDARRIAAYVARRTKLSAEAIAAILDDGGRAEREPSFWFG